MFPSHDRGVGTQGTQGIQGVQGTQGTQGTQGIQGATGVTPGGTEFYIPKFSGTNTLDDAIKNNLSDFKVFTTTAGSNTYSTLALGQGLNEISNNFTTIQNGFALGKFNNRLYSSDGALNSLVVGGGSNNTSRSVS